MIVKEDFNSKLFLEISKVRSNISLDDIVQANLQRDKECCTNSYMITNENLFFAILELFDDYNAPIDSAVIDDDKTKMFSQGRFDWSRDMETGEFMLGYIGFYILDTFLFGEERMLTEKIEEYKEIIESGQDQTGYFKKELEKLLAAKL
jgi:hypothetical protein